ncbi:MAG: autotransporter domain-containing protein [Chlamydiia bacterium]
MNGSSTGDICTFITPPFPGTTTIIGTQTYAGPDGVTLSNSSTGVVTLGFIPSPPSTWFIPRTNLTFGGGAQPLDIQTPIFLNATLSNPIFNISSGCTFAVLQLLSTYQANVLANSTITQLSITGLNCIINVTSGATLTLNPSVALQSFSSTQPYTFTGGGTILLRGPSTLPAVDTTISCNLDISELPTQTLQNLAGSGSIIITTSGIIINNTSTSLYTGSIRGVGGLGYTLTKTGPRTIQIGGANAIQGQGSVNINQGAIELVGSGDISTAITLSILGTSSFDIAGITGASTQINTLSGGATTTISLGNKTLVIAGTGTSAGQIDGTGGITKTGAGILTLSGSNTYTGRTTVATGAGALALTGTSSISISSIVEVNSTLYLTGSTLTQAILNNLQGAATGIVNYGTLALSLNFTQAATFAGTLSGTGAIQISGGSSTFNFSGTVSQNPTINLTGGTLALLGAGTISNSAALVMQSGSSLDITQVTSQAIIRNLSGSGSISVGTKNLNLRNTVTSTYAGTISGSSSAVLSVTNATANTVLTGAITGFGTVDIPQNTLFLSQGNLSTAGVVIFSPGRLDLSGSGSGIPIGTIIGDGTLDLGGSTLVIAGGASSTFTGTINGNSSAGLTKNGIAILTLSSSIINFTGPVNVSAGVLALGGTTSFANCSEVIVNGTLDLTSSSIASFIVPSLSGGSNGILNIGSIASTTLVNNTNATYSGDWINNLTTSTITKTGGGQLYLTESNSFTGVVAIGEGAILLTGNGALANASAINISATATLNVSGVGSGPATIITLPAINSDPNSTLEIGANSLYITKTSTFGGILNGTTGGITIDIPAGTVELVTAGQYTGSTTVSNGALLLTNNGSISSSSSVIANSGIDISTLSTSTTFNNFSGNENGLVNCGSNDLFLNISSQTNYAGSFLGTSQIIKLGLENLNLTGTSGFAGRLDIQQGSVSLNGDLSLSDGFIHLGALLSGNGKINNLTCQGTISPGNSIGVLTIVGNFNISGTAQIEMTGAGSADLINVTGTTTIQPGAIISLTTLPGFFPQGQTYTVIQSAGGLTGTFIPQIPQGLDFLVTYDSFNTYVVVKTPGFVVPVPPGQLNGAAKAVAQALFSSNSSSNADFIFVKATLVTLSPEEYIRALDDIAPKTLSGCSILELENNSRILSLLQNRIIRFHKPLCDSSVELPFLTFWLTPTTFWLRQQEVNDGDAFKSFTSGGTAGVEANFRGNLLLGFGGGYTYSGINWSGPGDSGIINEGYFGPYLGARFGKTYLAGSVMGSYGALKMNRTIQFGQINRLAVSHFSDWNITTMADIKHYIELPRNYYLLPEASINTSQLFRQRGKESGAQSLDFSYESSFNLTMRSFLNMASGIRICMSKGINFDGRINVGYLNTQLFTNNHTFATFSESGEIPSPGVYLTGIIPSINQGVIGCLMEIQQFDRAKLEFKSSYTFGGVSSVAEVDLSFEISF